MNKESNEKPDGLKRQPPLPPPPSLPPVMLDCNGLQIEIGDTVTRLTDGETGVVVDVIRPDKHRTRSAYVPLYFGDMVVKTSWCSSTISNNYKNWRVIKKAQEDGDESTNP